MEIKSVAETEKLETGEGDLRPLLFGKNLSLNFLEVPPGLEVPPHGHPSEGILYCLEGELDITGKKERVKISGGTALLLSPNEEIGMKNSTENTAKTLLISSPPPVSSPKELKEFIKKYGPADQMLNRK